MNELPVTSVEEKQKSYLGTASVVISVATAMLVVPWVILGLFLFSRLGDLERGAFAAYVMGSAVFAIIIIVLQLIGIILGVWSWTQNRTRNTLAKIGVVANSLLIILDIFLVFLLISGLFMDVLRYVPSH